MRALILNPLAPMLGALLLSTQAQAEGGFCPPGTIDHNNGRAPAIVCSPIPGYGQQQPAAPVERWQDRYGAIYLDWTKGAVGTSSSKSSRAAAEQAAIADCKARGGVDCKQLNSYRNACAAFSVADAGYGSASRETLNEAKKISMSECKDAGNTNCRVYYTDCSQPVRIQ